MEPFSHSRDAQRGQLKRDAIMMITAISPGTM
jgi:hypothetical protein